MGTEVWADGEGEGEEGPIGSIGVGIAIGELGSLGPIGVGMDGAVMGRVSCSSSRNE